MRRAPAQLDPEEGTQVNPVFDLDTLDVSGAIREHEEAVAGDTRAVFFRKAAVGGGALLTSGGIMAMLPEMAAAKPSKKQDLKILNYALVLEYLEATFYEEAVSSGALSGEAFTFAQTVARHEKTHVEVLKKTIRTLHGKPVGSPTFDFKGTNKDQAEIHRDLVRAGEHRRARLPGPGHAPEEHRPDRRRCVDRHGRGPPRRGCRDPAERRLGLRPEQDRHHARWRVRHAAFDEGDSQGRRRHRVHLMMNVGPMEIILVLAVALIILGPKKLPDAGRSLGRGMREFKDSLSGVTADAKTEEPAELR